MTHVRRQALILRLYGSADSYGAVVHYVDLWRAGLE
jgi:hypothetical protein